MFLQVFATFIKVIIFAFIIIGYLESKSEDTNWSREIAYMLNFNYDQFRQLARFEHTNDFLILEIKKTSSKSMFFILFYFI